MRVSQVSLLRLVRMAPWVVGDEMIGARVSGIGVRGHRRPALMIIQNCSPNCKTNPPVIVQLFEFDARSARPFRME